MLRYVLFDLRLFSTEKDTPSSRKGLLWLLTSLSKWNEIFLRDNPQTPRLYDLYKKGVVKYKVPEQFKVAEVPAVNILAEVLKKAKAGKEAFAALQQVAMMCGGGEHFRDIPAVIENGGGDCDNIMAWRVAELRAAGIPAKPRITWRKRPGGGMTYHALVLWPDGSSEDPSLILGMGGDERKAEREEELRKNAERRQNAENALTDFAAKVLTPQSTAPATTDWEDDASATIDWGDDK